MPRITTLIALLLLTSALQAEDKKASITDPAKAGPDFALQGEYRGKLPDGKDYGVQVVALGNDKFDIVLYTGGLPGDGWKKGEKKEKYKGEMKDGALVFTTGELTGSARNGAMILGPATLKKVERKSPTLGAEPPKGAIVLFDGKEISHFNPGTKTADGYLKHGQTSKHQFTKSFTLHLEFRLCYEPYNRGQGRSNSGVYLSGDSEVQVLDSFGLEGKNNECGGFYSKREPDVNMCFPPLAWQTYDIEVIVPSAKEAKTLATVKHNGVVIHQDVPIAFKSGGTLNLQDHGNPVAYRNIWVVEK